jgi:DNA-binding NarL/FixJ family response regulator
MTKMGRNNKLAPKRRILLVEEHPVFRRGFSLLLNQEKDLEVCGEAGTAVEALAAIETLKPDLVITGIALSGRNGLELAKDLAALHPQLPTLVYSGADESFYAFRALRAGAKGYLAKQSEISQVLEAIRTVLAGEIHLSNKMRARMFENLGSGNRAADTRPQLAGVEALSDRELEVFRLIGQGIGTRQIAADLNLSSSTVEAHRTNIKTKLGTKNSPHLMLQAVQWLSSQAPNSSECPLFDDCKLRIEEQKARKSGR